MGNKFCLFMTFLFFIFSSQSYAKETIRITNGEWPPLFSKDLKFYGFTSCIVTESFAMEGIEVIYGFFPWKRSYLLSQNGTWDGAIGWPRSKEREKFHYYSEHPISEEKWVFFYRKDASFDWNTLNDLMHLKFGVTIGNWGLDGEDEFTKALRKGVIKFEYAAEDKLNFLKLNLKRIDVFPQQLNVGYQQLDKLVKEKRLTKRDASNITHHQKPIRNMKLYLLLSKKKQQNRKMMKLFNNGFRKLKESGRYNKILDDFRHEK